MGKKYIGYAGTYTRESSEGIYRFVLDSEAGTLQDVEVAATVGSPTYLAISENQRYLYSVAQEDTLGGVYAYEVDSESGELRYVNKKLEEGAPPCHVDIQNGVLTTANYHKGTVDLYQAHSPSNLSLKGAVEHEGSGPHARQEKPHTHYAAQTPDGKYVIACDLGTDEVITYKIENQELVKVATLTVKAGSGPRHLTFHPDGKIAYLLTELSSEVVVLDYHADKGSFTEKQNLSAIPADFTETNDASAIHITSDGKFVYTGNRGHNSIAVFRVDEETKELTLVEITATEGDWPRDFVLDPSEAFIIASNQKSGNLVLFSRDQETGKLTQLDSIIDIPEVVCVKFLG